MFETREGAVRRPQREIVQQVLIDRLAVNVLNSDSC